MDAPLPAKRIVSAGWPAGPARAPFPGGKIHLWLADLDAFGWPEASGLPSVERRRAAAILRPVSASRWTASRWALRGVLSRYLGQEPARVPIAVDEHGKPRLKTERSPLRFNLSHSGTLALIVVAGVEVGVDVEATRPGRDFVALAERSFGAERVAAVRAAPPERRAEVFYAAWVRHESLAKCEGGGLGSESRGRQMSDQPILLGAGYVAAVAVAAPSVPPLHKWSINPPHAESVANLQE